MIDLTLLGALEIRVSGPKPRQVPLTQPKRLALLVYLALAEPFGFQSRERLMAVLWPEADDASARHSLRNALHTLRQVLGDDVIVTRGESFVGLDAGLIRCDARDMRAHLAAGRLEEGLGLWGGELAPGFHVSGAPEFERWLDEQRAQLQRAVRAAAWKRARELAGSGQSEVDAMRRATRLDPGNELAVRALMHVLVAAGDRAGALREYQSLTEHLAHELEVVPCVETQALAAELRSANLIRTADEAVHAKRSAELPTPLGNAPVPINLPAADPPFSTRSRRMARTAVGLAIVTVGALVIAMNVSHREHPEGTDTEAERALLRLPARYRADSSAYRSYLRGLSLRFEFDFRASRDTFAALVHREPAYVPGLYGLAHAYALLGSNGLSAPEEAWPKAEQAARTALALDRGAASAWFVLAGEDMHWNLDFERAREKIARGRMLDSLDPDGPALLSVWFRFQGQMDSAVAESRHATALDPLSRYLERLNAKQLYFARRYEESRAAYSRMLTDDPNWQRGYEDFALVHLAMRHPRDAVEWYRRARAAAGDSAGAAALRPVSTDSEAVRMIQADARRQIGLLDGARGKGTRVLPLRYASEYAILADTVETLRWLDSATTWRGTERLLVRVDPLFDFVRRDPRYAAWEERAGSAAKARGGAGEHKR